MPTYNAVLECYGRLTVTSYGIKVTTADNAVFEYPTRDKCFADGWKLRSDRPLLPDGSPALPVALSHVGFVRQV